MLSRVNFAEITISFLRKFILYKGEAKSTPQTYHKLQLLARIVKKGLNFLEDELL